MNCALPLPTSANSLAQPCAAEGCTRLAGNRKRLCSAHHARVWRGQSLSTPIRSRYDSPMGRVEAAAFDLGFVSSDDDQGYTAARERLRKAVEAAAEARCFRLRHGQDAVALAPEAETPTAAEV
jgi:hypothetical protein